MATLAQAKSAITREHERAGYTSPCGSPHVKSTWEGIRRQLGVAPKQKQPLDARELRAMYAELPAGILGLRDRALIGLGFAGGFRRSELVALDVADLTFVADGLEALVRRSKTDQEGKGLTKNVASVRDPSMCPVSAVHDWLELAGIGAGPLGAADVLLDRTLERVRLERGRRLIQGGRPPCRILTFDNAHYRWSGLHLLANIGKTKTARVSIVSLKVVFGSIEG